MRRVSFSLTAHRIACSRWLGRLLFGRPEMVCARADWHRWPVRHALNALFLDRWHCAAAADWEARQEREETMLEEWRRCGWL